MQSNNADDLLQFKDYSNTPSTSSPPQINVNSPTNQGGRTGATDPLADLMYNMTQNLAGSAEGGKDAGDGQNANETSAKVSFLTMEYYQQFFNVDTLVVVERISNSMIPKRAPVDYLKSYIGQNPDLYGPFWITVTLIFSIAISGNIASYLQHANENFHWRYNFHLVSYAATCIFVYANFVPAALWAVFKYSLKPVEEDLETQSATYTPSLLSLMCVYGYSLAIYIPVSILWVIQFSLLQWLLVITAALLSGSVLIAVLTPALRNSKLSLFLIVGILAAHFLLAAGFMLYFFHVPSTSSAAGAAPPQPEHLKQLQSIVSTTVKAVVGNLTT